MSAAVAYAPNRYSRVQMNPASLNYAPTKEWVCSSLKGVPLHCIIFRTATDPAIGSGAFPVGMMNEIVRARGVLNPDKPVYELKRNAIENSIYGVDIDPGAVEIAKLRFWLSLVVDEENTKEISPLPNLDYKIMQGNSLITSYEGIDFDKIIDDYKPDTQLTINLWGDKSKDIKTELSSLLSKFFETSHSTEKKKLKEQIEGKIIELVKNNFEEKAKKEGKPANYYEDDIRKFAQNKENRNFFPWKLFFGDAFKQGGFDVVIGNPPYIKEYTNRDAFCDLKTSPYYQGKMDLWYFFGCKGIDILKPNGIESYIAPNNWITNAGASIFRNKIIKESQIINFIDFSDYKVFDSAGIQTMVYILLKNKQLQKYKVNYSQLNCEKLINEENIINFLNFKINTDDIKYVTTIDRDEIFNNYIEFIRPEINTITSKIFRKKSINLLDSEIGQGIVAAPDKYFLITNIENFNKEELEYIKPYYTTVEKYYYQKDKRKIIYLSEKNFEGKMIEDYPNIYKHFLPNKKELTLAKIKYGTPNKPYYYLHRERVEKFFKSGTEKIISVGRTFHPKFCYTKDAFYGSRALFFIQTDRINLKYLTGILNSSIIHFWLYHKGKKQGEQLQVDKEPLMNIPIATTNKNNELKIINIVDKILELTQSDNYLENIEKQNAVKEYENQIDIIVYKLYDLTYEEVLTIDKDFKLLEDEYNRYKI